LIFLVSSELNPEFTLLIIGFPFIDLDTFQRNGFGLAGILLLGV